jgi:hypothetical protein
MLKLIWMNRIGLCWDQRIALRWEAPAEAAPYFIPYLNPIINSSDGISPKFFFRTGPISLSRYNFLATAFIVF